MKVRKIDFEKAGHLSELCQEYLKDNPKLSGFYGQKPDLKSFKKQIDLKKNFPQETREILQRVINQQYEGLEISPGTQQNIHRLTDSNTFTVTTGHQLNIFTGPLYFIYKIISTIKAAEKLNEQYQDYHFVPVYWMASEDHDFEEISTFRLYGENYTWKTDQKGAVGHFDPKELKEILSEMPGKNGLFEEAYLKHNTLADAVRYYVNELFGESGLVVLDPDNASLKLLFKDVIEADILKGEAKGKVLENNEKLENLGYGIQVFVRDINFFYLGDGFRARIEKNGDKFDVLETDISFSEADIKKEIGDSPEKFSPNVILRPLYQERVLPNLAYFGGPSEVTYWLQLKGVFDHFDTPIPVLVPRNFAVILPSHIIRKMEKCHIGDDDLFMDPDDLIREYTLENSDKELSLNGKREKIEEVYEVIQQQAEAVDVTLGPMVEGFAQKASKGLEKIEKKILRAQKKNMSDKTRQITEVFQYTRPGGVPQERSDNFLNFYHTNPRFIEDLKGIFDPFDFSYLVLRNE